MSLRRWIAAFGVALLVGGGFVAARWFLASDATPPIPGPRGVAAPADDRFPPALTGASEEAESSRADARRVEEAARLAIQVRVVDVRRVPVADVPVALGVPGSLRQQAIVARSGRDGLARIAGYEAALAREDPAASWTLHFPFPELAELEPTAVPIDPRHPPAEPVEMVVPALGRLVIKLVDADGRPLATRGVVSLEVRPVGRSSPSDHQEWPLTAPDELVVDPIAIGLRVRAEAEVAEYAMPPAEADGPQRQGETATLVMKAVRHGPILIGQLIGPDGKPVASLPLAGIVHDDPDLHVTIGDVVLATDHEGRFRFDASHYELEEPDRKRWLDLVDRNDRRGMSGRARAPVPTPFLSGELDLGRVDFEPAPQVVSGRVVAWQDSAAAPAAPAANVQICVCLPNQSANPAMRRGGVGTNLVARSDESGAFTIHGFVEREEHAVFAFDDQGRRSAPVRFLPGATGLELTIVEFGSLEGSLVMDPAIDSIHVGVFFRRSVLGEDGVFESRVSPNGDGAFRWDSVPAGRIDVAVGLGRYSDRPEVVLVVPGVEVKPNQMNHDPRLEGIDLAPRIGKARVELVDTSGAPLRGGSVTLLANDASHALLLTVVVDGGAVELPLLHPTFDVEVRAAGMATERRFGLVSPARIVMRPGFSVVVALEPPLAERSSAGAVTLRLTLTSAHSTIGFIESQQRVDLGGDGRGALLLPEACRYQVDLEASCDFAKGGDALAWRRLCGRLRAEFGNPMVEVLESRSEQRLVVPVPAAARAVIDEMFQAFGGG